MRRRGLALVLIAVLATACSSAPEPTPVLPADAAEFVITTCVAFDEFLLALGNPDAGVPSDAWLTFEQAIERGDPDVLQRSGAEILAHLEASAAANRRGATWPPGTAANAELDAILRALETQVRTVLEANGAPDVAARAEAIAEEAWVPHWTAYLQAMQLLVRTTDLRMPNLPCPDVRS